MLYNSFLSITYSLMSLLSSISFTYNTINKLIFNPYDKEKYITIGDGKNLRVGILSDSQLTYGENDKTYPFSYDHLIRSFEVMKDNNINVLIFAGDEGQAGTTYAFNLFKKAIDKVWPNKDERPIFNFIMGNHDYKYNLFLPSYHQKKFYEIIGEKPFSHKIINGYHFINWGHCDLSMQTSNNNYLWVEREIKKAIKSDDKKPIFVTTHVNAKGTVYGSDRWGNNIIKSVLDQFKQVIHFSGHSHFSLIDERSIWQGKFTAIQTQGTCYIELENGKENGSKPLNEFNEPLPQRLNYVGLIMDVNNDKVIVKRISLEKNKFYGNDWIIDIPISEDKFRYKEGMREKYIKAPWFEKNEVNVKQVVKDNKKFNHIHFIQAKHDNFVHSYKLVFNKNGRKKEYLYFSDFFLLPEDRKNDITLKLNDKLEGDYEVEIYAIESFGKESKPIKANVTIPEL